MQCKKSCDKQLSSYKNDLMLNKREKKMLRSAVAIFWPFLSLNWSYYVIPKIIQRGHVMIIVKNVLENPNIIKWRILELRMPQIALWSKKLDWLNSSIAKPSVCHGSTHDHEWSMKTRRSYVLIEMQDIAPVQCQLSLLCFEHLQFEINSILLSEVRYT